MSQKLEDLYHADTPDVFFDYIESCDVGLRGQIPQGERWSLAMLTRHIVDAEMQSYCRFMDVLAADGPAIQNYDENLWTALPREMSIAAARSMVCFIRQQVCGLIATNPEQKLREAYGVHSVRGKVYFTQLLEIYEAHMHTHLAQAQRIYAALVV